MPDVIAFPNRAAALPELPDIAVAALPLFARLRDALRALNRPAPRPRWNVPPLFFFDRTRESARAAKATPDHLELADWLDDALTVVAASTEARRAARSTPGLLAAATAAPLRAARELAGLLGVADDEMIRVLHPAARTGFRVHVRGIADLAQFHALLADEITGDPGRGKLPGTRPDPRVLAAFRNDDPDPDAAMFPARFQFYRPAALRSDGTLPSGFKGSRHWLWGPESLSVVPRVDGERLLLIGEPIFPARWVTGRKYPGLSGELELVEVLSPAVVNVAMNRLTGLQPSDRVRRAG